MSLNDNPISKEVLRREIAVHTEKFLDGGGMISRDRGSRVSIVCRLCQSRPYVSTAFALRFRPACTKCGGEARMEI
jgi:hypothetical protein